MRTIIAGSRGITDYRILLAAIDGAYLCGVVPSVVLSGTAHGADQLGERWAREHGVPLELYPAQWQRYGKSAGFRRNTEMARQADALIALWDGCSNGTDHMIRAAYHKRLEVIVWRV